MQPTLTLKQTASDGHVGGSALPLTLTLVSRASELPGTATSALWPPCAKGSSARITGEGSRPSLCTPCRVPGAACLSCNVVRAVQRSSASQGARPQRARRCRLPPRPGGSSRCTHSLPRARAPYLPASLPAAGPHLAPRPVPLTAHAQTQSPFRKRGCTKPPSSAAPQGVWSSACGVPLRRLCAQEGESSPRGVMGHDGALRCVLG